MKIVGTPATIVTHKPRTGHLRCECGERIAFTAGSNRIQAMVDVQLTAEQRTGKCPKCGLTHLVPIPNQRYQKLRRAAQIALIELYASTSDSERSEAKVRLAAATTALRQESVHAVEHIPGPPAATSSIS